MRSLPLEYKLLKKLQEYIDIHLSSKNTNVEIYSNELYDIIKNKPTFRNKFPNNTLLNQFLRNMYHKHTDAMNNFLNYRVDTTIPHHYKWHFRRKNKVKKVNPINTNTLEGSFNYYDKKIEGPDGVKVRSKQERKILTKLKNQPHLEIKVEFPLVINKETKQVDFIIKNKITQKTFYWEHFGMTNNEEYKNAMTEKIEWYRNNGFKIVEENGNMIYTYFKDENNFHKDIEKYINIITENKIQTSKHIDLPKVELFSDGGAEPNPGRGGYGIILRSKGKSKEFFQGYSLTTNNRMELMGVISGLEKLKTKCNVQVHTDSKYVIDGITKGWAEKWKNNNWYRNKTDKAINADLWDRLLKAIYNHDVTFHWVKGHAGHIENERCDALAEMGIKSENPIMDEGYKPNTSPKMKKEKKVKINSEGQKCRKCGTPVIKRTRKKPTKFKKGQTYYYAYNFHCPNCKTTYQTPDAKIEIPLNQETEINNTLFD